MSEDAPQGPLDELVRLLARGMDLVGLNGRRLLWKWSQRRKRMGEAGFKTEQMVRSARGQHKMCPSCRSLMPRSAKRCPDCGSEMGEVAAPGVGRLFANVLPGASAATSLLMLVNGFWFVLMLMAQFKTGDGAGGLFSSFSGELMVRFGSGLSRPVQVGNVITGGEWWRIVTPIFLHAGLIHFFFNSYVLLQIGPVVEQLYGTERFWVIYLTCGITGSWTSQLFPTNTIGASGAIMGLMGLLLVFGQRHGGALGQSLKSMVMRFAMYMIVISLLFWNRLDHINHVAGFACGALLAMVVPSQKFGTAAEKRLWQLLSLAGVIVVLVAFAHVAGAFPAE